jgi:hypothetical protein
MSFSEKVFATLKNERKAGLKGRPDMKIIDHEITSSCGTFARVLIAFDKTAGDMQPQHIEQFFVGKFGNAVKPHINTLRTIKQDGYTMALVTAETFKQVRNINDATHMQRVNAMTYTANGELWTVQDDSTGNKHLVKVSEDNLGELLEMNKQREHRAAPRVASLKEAFCHCEVGDTVKFFDNNSVQYGTLVKESDASGMVTIKSRMGSITTDHKNVLSVMSRGAKAVSDDKSILNEYFSKAYGDKQFAKELTTKSILDNTNGDLGLPKTPATKLVTT